MWHPCFKQWCRWERTHLKLGGDGNCILLRVCAVWAALTEWVQLPHPCTTELHWASESLHQTLSWREQLTLQLWWRMPALLMHLMMTLLLWELSLPLGDFLLGSDWVAYSTTGHLDSWEQGLWGSWKMLPPLVISSSHHGSHNCSYSAHDILCRFQGFTGTRDP